MTGWPRVALGEVFEIARGGSPRPIDAYITDDPAGINWISIGDASADSKFIRRTKKRIRPDGASRSRLVKPGDFLLTNSMSFGRPYIMETTGCIHDGWLVLGEKREGIDHNFFFHLLGSQAIYAEFTRLAAGATVKNLNIDLVSGVRVPVPPLAEQRRIADILDRAETLRAQRCQALAQLDTLMEAIFLDLFGDPTNNPMTWPRTTLGQLITEGPQNGLYKPAADYGSGTPILRIDGFYDGAVSDIGGLKRVRVSAAERETFGLQENDIVINRVNSPEYLGKCALIPTLPEPTVFESNMMRVAVNPGRVEPAYVVQFLQSGFIKAQIRTASKDAVNQSSINQQDVKAFVLNLPPLGVQHEFVRRLAAVSGLRARHEEALEEANALFASLQHRAFRGEL